MIQSQHLRAGRRNRARRFGFVVVAFPVLAVLLATPLRSGAARTEDGSAHAFLEVWIAEGPVHEQQTVPVSFRIGLDHEFFARSAVPLFRRSTDHDVQVRAPWLDGEGGRLRALSSEALLPSADTASFVLGDEIVRARCHTETREGIRFDVLEFERAVRPLAPGPFELGAPSLHFAYATRFEENFFGDRIPEDRIEAEVVAEPIRFEVLALPSEGRPERYTGAVGEIEIEASAEPGPWRIGDRFELTLSINGAANFEDFGTPVLGALPGLFVAGSREERSDRARRIVYDVEVRGGPLSEIPPLEVPYFGTDAPAGYRVARSRPVPIRVDEVGAGLATATEEPGPVLDEPEDAVVPVDGVADSAADSAADRGLHALKDVPPRGPGPRSRPQGALQGHEWSLLLAPWFAALGLLAVQYQRSRPKPDPLVVRAKRAAANFRRSTRNDEAPVLDAFAEYVGAKLHLPSAGAVSPSLAERLRAAGIPEELAQRTARVLENAYGSRFARQPGTEPREELLRLFEELETRFTARGGSR